MSTPVNKVITLDHYNQLIYTNVSTDTETFCPIEDAIRAAHGEDNVDSLYFDEYQPESQQTQDHLDAFVTAKLAEGYTHAS